MSECLPFPSSPCVAITTAGSCEARHRSDSGIPSESSPSSAPPGPERKPPPDSIRFADQVGDARDIAAGIAKARHQIEFDRARSDLEDDGNLEGRCPCRKSGWQAGRKN